MITPQKPPGKSQARTITLVIMLLYGLSIFLKWNSFDAGVIMPILVLILIVGGILRMKGTAKKTPEAMRKEQTTGTVVVTPSNNNSLAILILVVGAVVVVLLLLDVNPLKTDDCTTHADCDVPMEYLVRSNCPFGGACIEGDCYVVCPHTAYDAANYSLPVACEQDSDCDCSNRGTQTQECLCVDGGCLSIEDTLAVKKK